MVEGGGKFKNLLDDSKTYEIIKKDPTKKYKKELSALLMELKRNESIDYSTWDRMYSTSDALAKFYGFPKMH